MKVLVIDNSHFYKTPNGNYYTPSIYNNDFFQRYLEVFEEVRFVAKTKYVDEIDESKYIFVNIKGLEIYELPWYQGLRGLIWKFPKLLIKYINVMKGCDCYIYRVAQIESYLTYLLGRRNRKAYAVEVVNDPSTFVDVVGIFKRINIKMLKIMASKANGASYVTENILQELYPSRSKLTGESESYFEEHYSSVELYESDLKGARKYKETIRKMKIVHISNAINSDTKGHTTVIDVIKKLVQSNYEVEVDFIGDGTFVEYLKEYAKTLKVENKVNFIGRLSSKESVLAYLNKCDLFLYPTHAEGLPRVLIEAMAVGLPCLSTMIAGIPELLENKYLFSPNDSEGFAIEIMRLFDNPLELESMSEKNNKIAQKYVKEKLYTRRTNFYFKLRALAERNLRIKNNNLKT